MRRGGLWVALGGIVLAVVLIAGRPPSDGPPLDPSSVGPLGTRALVLLLERFGAEVDLTDRPVDHDVALVLADDLDDAGRSEVEHWVHMGGILVVADPRSPLNPYPTAGQAAFGPLNAEVSDDTCPLDALAGIETVETSGGVTFRSEAGVGCYTEAGGAFLVAQAVGTGAVVSIGGAGSFVNESIGDAQNAALAAALLVPRPGTRVAFLRPPVPGSGETSLTDLISGDVKAAGLQLGIAFLVYALWRARRLGSPVSEQLPPSLTASELVLAVGNLLHHARRHDQAAGLLRDDVRRALAQRLGLPADAPADVVAAAAGARSGVPVPRVQKLLQQSPLGGADELVALAADLETMRQEVIHAR